MKTTRTQRPRSPVAPVTLAGFTPSTEPAIVEEVGERLRVRRSGDGASRAIVDARLARIPGYVPSIGDRVIVSFGASESYVIAVLHAAEAERAGPQSLRLPDGARVEVLDGRLELRDAAGRLLVRYHDGHAEITAPSGDLRLAAPGGRVVVESALDVVLRSERDVLVETGRRFEVGTGARGDAGTRLSLDGKRASLRAPEVEVTSKSARLATGRATVFARSIATTAEHLAQKVVKYELHAERIVERSRDSFREVEGLAQSCAGQLRTIVKDVFSLRSRRSVLNSTDDTCIDGSKVLLG
jgi:hypothetical protein